MEDAKEMKTPTHPNTSLGLEKDSKSIDHTTYKRMIGALLYLTTSRLYIMFKVCLCGHFQSDPRDVHLSVVKGMIRYFKSSTNLGLCYKKQENHTF